MSHVNAGMFEPMSRSELYAGWVAVAPDPDPDIFRRLMDRTGALVGGASFLSGRVGTLTWWSSVSVLAVDLVLSVICLLKGKVTTGVIGLVVSIVAFVGAVRLAKPESWWARHHYASRPQRAARPRARSRGHSRRSWNGGCA